MSGKVRDAIKNALSESSFSLDTKNFSVDLGKAAREGDRVAKAEGLSAKESAALVADTVKSVVAAYGENAAASGRGKDARNAHAFVSGGEKFGAIKRKRGGGLSVPGGGGSAMFAILGVGLLAAFAAGRSGK